MTHDQEIYARAMRIVWPFFPRRARLMDAAEYLADLFEVDRAALTERLMYDRRESNLAKIVQREWLRLEGVGVGEPARFNMTEYQEAIAAVENARLISQQAPVPDEPIVTLARAALAITDGRLESARGDIADALLLIIRRIEG